MNPIPLSVTPTSTPSASSHWFRTIASWLGVIVLAIASGGALYYFTMKEDASVGPETAETEEVPGSVTTVTLPKNQWENAEIQIESVSVATISESVQRTGKLALNESRLAHKSAMVPGVIREVKVQIGQDVQAGDVLVILDCREVGQAKLDLVKSRLAAQYAQTQHEWTKTTATHAQELVEVMQQDAPIAQIEEQFQNKPMGEFRQQLITAYSKRIQSRLAYISSDSSQSRGAIPETTIQKLKAEFETAEATFRSLCEETKYTTVQQVRASEQKWREAQNTKTLSETQLLMLGYSRAEVEAMDPISEGEKLSHYPIRAPFAGTIIAQHAVISERVGPEHQLFQIADLSELWVQVDVPQSDVGLLSGLTGQPIEVHLLQSGHKKHVAEVFYTGDVVDPATRTLTLFAKLPNPQRQLKPGQFVRVQLPIQRSNGIQIPASALLMDNQQAFVCKQIGPETFERVDVQVVKTSGSTIEVLSGLAVGDNIVTSGTFVLKSLLFRDQLQGE